MVRAVAGVLLGYVTMAVLVFTTFTTAYLGMGTDQAFCPGSYDPSPLWTAVSFVLGFVAAVVGGYACARVSRLPKPPLVLAGLVIVLGLLSAIPHLTATDEPKSRSGDVSNMEAMMNAHQPAWVALLNPFIGAAGVLVGSRRRPAG